MRFLLFLKFTRSKLSCLTLERPKGPWGVRDTDQDEENTRERLWHSNVQQNSVLHVYTNWWSFLATFSMIAVKVIILKKQGKTGGLERKNILRYGYVQLWIEEYIFSDIEEMNRILMCAMQAWFVGRDCHPNPWLPISFSLNMVEMVELGYSIRPYKILEQSLQSIIP